MSFKETLFTKILTLRHLFIVGNALLLVVFLAVVVKDYSREWKKYQKEFYQREKDRLHGELQKNVSADRQEALERELRVMRGQRLSIKQIMQTEFNRYDRCTTCHLGMDPNLNPRLTTIYEDQPFTAPVNEIHIAHPVETFGCTVCHGGQGLATTVEAAHGRVEHWEEPLLLGAYLQASCAKCHGNLNDEEAMPFTAAWRRGQEIFEEKGCIGCHQVRGVGGPIAVDLAEETASKPLTRIDFSRTGLPKEERTLTNWIRLHFIMDPQELVPGDPEAHFNDEPIAPSGMPFYDLSDKDADAITTYVMSLKRDPIPAHFVRLGPKQEEPRFSSAVDHGRFVYQKYGCASCHGPDGQGGIRNYNYENTVEPDITATVGTFTREELREKIENGVPVVGKADPNGPTPPLYMPGWKSKIKGEELEDLLTYLFSIAQEEEEW